MKKLLLFVAMLLFVGSFSSCSKIYDKRLDRLDESIENLKQNYKVYSPRQLRQEIEKCENLIDKLHQDESKLSIAQRKRLNKLTRKETRVMLLIVAHLKAQDVSDDITELLQYIKEILKKKFPFINDSTDSMNSLDFDEEIEK